MSITYSECTFLASGTQLKCTCIILPSVICQALQYFSTLSYKRHDFRGGGGGEFTVNKKFCFLCCFGHCCGVGGGWFWDLLYTKCVFWFSVQLLTETSLILRRSWTTWSKMYMVFLSYFNKSWTFSTDFRKILKLKISWKSVQREPSCSMRTDRQTDMTKPTVVFAILRTRLRINYSRYINPTPTQSTPIHHFPWRPF
jgi:hypothetical protein